MPMYIHSASFILNVGVTPLWVQGFVLSLDSLTQKSDRILPLKLSLSFRIWVFRRGYFL